MPEKTMEEIITERLAKLNATPESTPAPESVVEPIKSDKPVKVKGSNPSKPRVERTEKSDKADKKAIVLLAKAQAKLEAIGKMQLFGRGQSLQGNEIRALSEEIKKFLE